MEIGLSSILCLAYRSVQEYIDFLSKQHVSYIDFFIIPPYIDFNNLEPITNLIKKRLGDNIKITVKAPSFVENLTSILDKVQNLTFKEYMDTLDLAKRVGAKAVIIKPGMMFYTEKKCKNYIMEKFLEYLYTLAEIAEKSGIYLLLENYYYPYEILRGPRDFCEVYNLIKNYEHLGFALNIPHLLESKGSVNLLIRKCEREVLERIKLVYLGLRPSPWENTKYIQSIAHVLKEAKKLFRIISPEFVIIASVSEPIVRIFLDGVRDIR